MLCVLCSCKEEKSGLITKLPRQFRTKINHFTSSESQIETLRVQISFVFSPKIHESPNISSDESYLFSTSPVHVGRSKQPITKPTHSRRIFSSTPRDPPPSPCSPTRQINSSARSGKYATELYSHLPSEEKKNPPVRAPEAQFIFRPNSKCGTSKKAPARARA